MNSVKDIFGIALVKGVGRYQPPEVKIISEVAGKLVNNAVTTVLYEEIEKELAEKTTRT